MLKSSSELASRGTRLSPQVGQQEAGVAQSQAPGVGQRASQQREGHVAPQEQVAWRQVHEEDTRRARRPALSAQQSSPSAWPGATRPPRPQPRRHRSPEAAHVPGAHALGSAPGAGGARAGGVPDTQRRRPRGGEARGRRRARGSGGPGGRAGGRAALRGWERPRAAGRRPDAWSPPPALSGVLNAPAVPAHPADLPRGQSGRRARGAGVSLPLSCLFCPRSWTGGSGLRARSGLAMVALSLLEGLVVTHVPWRLQRALPLLLGHDASLRAPRPPVRWCRTGVTPEVCGARGG